MKDFVKRNFVLILGVSLPVVLIATLLLVHGISRLTANKPAYPVLYVSFDDYLGRQFFDFDIDEAGRLAIGFRLPENDMAATPRQPTDAILALFDARSGTLDTFRVEAPADPPRGQRVEIAVPGRLSAATFSEQAAAPDGYRLVLSGYRGGGLLGEIFGAGGRSRHHRLVDDGVSFRVPDVGAATYAYQDAFIGWLVENHE